MKHVIPLALKLVLWSTVLFSIFTIFNAPLLLIFFIALATVTISYALGDLFVLPRAGNFVAVIADLPLAFATIWFFSYLLIEPTANMLYASFFATLALGAIEAFFHLFMENRVFTDKRMHQTRNWFDEGRWAVEFAEEYEEKRKRDDR
ncbi:capsule polysaccharide modification protein KpsS [Anoxybacillus tepidamans]|uniref:Capsule polysaccharide modification protein KpsS n=1 Tax=Anoxybacteroides tepidamans TaxID=265948 RepID=A0A7W8IS61_9BACL|nr:YndM family protein [Anoxybacillus tepidamans]MBB5325667.1 capsule polysaccharide modification protein KpsS [Anoxybacillus tepidamans]